MEERDRSAAVSRRVVVHGRVQGVFFRAATREEAQRRGLTGWVRNRSDGSVEAVFEGTEGAVAAAIAFCERGPAGARVERLETFEADPTGLTGFEVRR